MYRLCTAEDNELVFFLSIIWTSWDVILIHRKSLYVRLHECDCKDSVRKKNNDMIFIFSDKTA